MPLQKCVARWGIVFALCGPPQSFTGHTRTVHMPQLGNPLAATVNVQELLFDLPTIMAHHRHFAGGRGVQTCWESECLGTKLMGRCVVAGRVDWIGSLWVLRG